MTDLELKQLEEQLWHSADLLRAGAHMSATSYGEPILGLIFLRYADIRYKQFKDEIEAEFTDGTLKLVIPKQEKVDTKKSIEIK